MPAAARTAGLKLPLLVLLLGVAMAAAACGDGGGSPASASPTPTAPHSASASPASTSPTSTSPTASPTGAQTRSAASACVERTLAGMSTAQRVGQLFMSAVSSSGPTAAQLQVLRQGQVGSVILMGHTEAGSRAVRAGTDRVQALAPTVAGSRVGLLVGVDQEGGQIQVLGGPGFSAMPSAAEQGGWPTALLQGRAATWGRQLAQAGVQLDLAPVVDVVPAEETSVNEPIGRLARGFGSTPGTVARQSSAFVRGLRQSGVLSTLKHFPSLGHVQGNTDFAANVVDNVTGPDGDFVLPYRSGIQAGAQFVMVALATYTRIDPRHPAVFSPTVVRGLLRGTIGFQGVVVSDDLGNAASVRSVPAGQRATGFLAAGGDLVLTVDPATVGAMTAAVLAEVNRDPAFRKGVDASVRRVLTAKLAAGLLTCPH
ncbi:glycoside hydrolase family 3 N-terminal domain-containing protein [Streptacidiphilus sp. N1-3]|uniref:beta-N-acetylhexosaminidase n=1 Tax=Streptacidiphilus alkalitolerans TaxID=3342712 RepID=A0ABV6XBS2_9ACTN